MGIVRDRFGAEAELAFCAGGIYVCYLYYGVLQEKIWKENQDGTKFTSTLFLLFVQCVFNFGLAALLMGVSGGVRTARKEARALAETSPLRSLGLPHSGNVWLAIISLTYMSAMGCSNQALQFVSYPFQAISKSCKMVPVMLGNVIVGGKRYSAKEIGTTLAITLGVVLFQLGKSKKGNESQSTMWGIGLLMGSLVLDGLTSSNQRLFSDEYKPSSNFLMLSMNLWSVLFLLPLLGVTGEGQVGLEYVIAHPELLKDIITFSLCSALGQQFIFLTIVGPGPLACTTITTTRKFFTVLLSVVLYPENSLNVYQWASVLLVFAGLGVELDDKRRKASKQKQK